MKFREKTEKSNHLFFMDTFLFQRKESDDGLNDSCSPPLVIDEASATDAERLEDSEEFNYWPGTYSDTVGTERT